MLAVMSVGMLVGMLWGAIVDVFVGALVYCGGTHADAHALMNSLRKEIWNIERIQSPHGDECRTAGALRRGVAAKGYSGVVLDHRRCDLQLPALRRRADERPVD